MRRRLYLVRHGAVSYFAPDGRPVVEDEVGLNDTGRAQAEATRDLLAGVTFDRVLASSLPRTLETARIVAPDAEVEQWPDLRELRGGRLSEIPIERLEEEFVHAFRGIVPLEKRFLGGETIAELFARVLPALDRLLADESWDTVLAVLHGAVNRASSPTRSPGTACFSDTWSRRPAASTCSTSAASWPADAIVRAVNIAAYDLLHTSSRLTTMEGYWEEFLAGPQ